MKRAIFVLGLMCLVAAVAGIVVAEAAYPGTTGPLALFNASFFVLVALAIPRPRSYVYGYFSVLCALGFWVKFNVHMLLQYAFVEPIGHFDNSPASWDRALMLCSAAAWGACIPRVCQLLFWRNRVDAQPEQHPVPAWYFKGRRWVWGLTLAVIGALALCNYNVAIYQIGVTPQLQLPRVASISAAWLISIGFALWLAVLVQWERLLRPANWHVALLAPLFEGFASSVSALSRSLYLLHAIPYFVALLKPGSGMRARPAVILTMLFVLSFGASIVVVQFDRSRFFSPIAAGFAAPPAAGSPVATTNLGQTSAPQNSAPQNNAPQNNEATREIKKAWLRHNFRQVVKMPVDRWIGMEGILAVSSAPRLGWDVFVEALTESPRLGTEALYQKVAKSKYRASEKFVFLTTPGVAGVLAFAGSLGFVVLGLALITSLIMGTEFAIVRLTRNPLLTSMAALAMTNIVHQLQFPYLAFTFFVELWFTIGGLVLISKWGAVTAPSKALPAVPHPHRRVLTSVGRQTSAASDQ